MSLIKLSGNPSGTGAFTIAAPNSNTDRTLTLPDATGTVVTADGSGDIATTSITPSAGIYLGGSGSANLLDDYEEGTFTPAFLSGSGITYSDRAGYYTKIGNVVTFHMYVAWSAGTSLVSAFSGLPFTVSNVNRMFPMCSVWNNGGVTYGAGRTAPVAFCNTNSTNVSIDSLGSAVNAAAPSYATSGEIYITGHYYTTA